MIRWSALCAAALLLAACPYGSEFPLGSPADAVEDEALIGTWETLAGGTEDLTLIISSFGGRELLIRAENPEEEPETLRAFVSAVDGERFLNIQDEDWILVNYRIEEGRLLLRIVDDELFESQSFTSPEELRAFVRQHLADPLLYGEEDGPEWDWKLDRAAPGA